MVQCWQTLFDSMTMIDSIGTCARMRTLVAALILLATASGSATAQTPAATMEDVLSFLVTNRGVETGDFDRDRNAAQATAETLTRALLSAISQVPIGTSSSGFTYRLNPTLGTVERASETFGPFFVERALTSGSGQASFSLTFQYASFASLDDYELQDGAFVTVANRFTDEPAPFDTETLTLNLSTRTTTVFGSFGLTDRLDVSAVVPMVSMRINGSRVNTYRGTSLVQARATATTFGFADVAVRSKFRFTPDSSASSAAAGVEVRLPTGRNEDLLGAGETAVRVVGMGSAEFGLASLHGNLTLGAGGLGRELSYGGAIAVAATPRLTLVGEVLGRRLAGAQRIAEVVAPHPRILGVETTRLMPAGAEQTSGVAVAGFKWNVSGTWLLQANVLLPLRETGLTTRVTPTIALDYSFTR
jgi:hypothetical protein